MAWLAKIVELLGMIPGAFWGVVVGSFFALGGVMLTNRANSQRLRDQFAHERELRIQDTELALRKDVYLAGAEAISAGLASVSRLANLDIPNDDVMAPWVEKSPAIAKMQIISSEPTLRAMTKVTGELSSTILKLVTARLPLMGMKQQIAFWDEQISRFSKERDRMLEEMKQYNLEGAVDPQRWTTINGGYEFEAGRISDALTEKQKLEATLGSRNIEYIEECFAETLGLRDLVVPAIIAARNELNLPIDEAAYKEIIEETNAKEIADLKQFLDELRTYLDTLAVADEPVQD